MHSSSGSQSGTQQSREDTRPGESAVTEPQLGWLDCVYKRLEKSYNYTMCIK